MAQKYNLSRHNRIKAVIIGIVGFALQAFWQIYQVNYDIFSMDYKAVINALISAVIPYLIVSFFSNESKIK